MNLSPVRCPALFPAVLLALLAACSSAPPSPQAVEAATEAAVELPPPDERWIIEIQGNAAGEMTRRELAPAPSDEEAADGSGAAGAAGAPEVTELWTFTFNDRGRGPELETRVGLDSDGIPLAIETVGHDYLKVPVAESFVRDVEGARWSSAKEEGELAGEAAGFYLSSDSAAPESALLARALLAAPGEPRPLLPEGEASAEVIGRRTLRAGGQEREVMQVAVSGLGFRPESVWLDADGSFFGYASAWFTLLPEGWQEVGDELRSAEEEAARAWAGGLAETLAFHPPGGIAITGVAVFDPATGTVAPGQTVVIRGERIVAAGPPGTVEIPARATVVDGAGKTLLPGLWDMHTHLSEVDGVLHLAAGVTSVRDLANDVELVTALRRSWDEETAPGPRVVLAGFLDGPGPYAGPTKALVSSLDEALPWIERYKAFGYEQIKLYSSLDPELVAPIAAAAHERGMRVSGHVPQGMTAEEAVRSGFDELQHVNFLFLNFWGDEGIDTRTPARFTEPAERAAAMALDSPEVAAFVRLLAERGIEVDPTLAVFEGMLTGDSAAPSPPLAMVADRLPVQIRRALRGGGLEPPPGMEETYRRSFRKLVEMVGVLYRAGVPIVAGTDGMAGFTLHRELELYVEAGIPPAEVLALATLGAARLTGRDAELGTVTPGKLADLVLVAGDPTRDISAIRRTELVIKHGTLYRPAELYEAVGVRP